MQGKYHDVCRAGQEIDHQHQNATPNASESGTLHRGFLISPAVKVTLFHASAAKSEPTCTTGEDHDQVDHDDGPLRACTGCSNS